MITVSADPATAPIKPAGIMVGYARVSTAEQGLDVQLSQLEAAGCRKIFQEKVSGATKKGRTELEHCLAFVREGDTLVVTRIDRLGRSVRDMLEIIEGITARGVNFYCISQPFFSISDSSGKLFLTFLAGFAEFELNVRRERQMEGYAMARAQGRKLGGSKSKYDKKKTIAAARKLQQEHHLNARQIARHLKMHVSTLYRITEGSDLWGEMPETLVRKIPAIDVLSEDDGQRYILQEPGPPAAAR